MSASFRVSSKAGRPGQWAGPAAAGVCLVLLGCGASAKAPQTAKTPSGLPVPRYAVLNRAPVNARGGPGEDYKALWTYQARGVPVQIVEETDEWRRICDPEGGLGWVRKRVLDTRPRVMRIAGSDLPLHRSPSDDARVVAMLAAHSTAGLAGCKGVWCRLSVDHATGWARAGQVWGTVAAPQCR